jgi:hypothetical protein
MIGRPEICTQDAAPQLLLGQIEFGPKRGPLPDNMREHLSVDTCKKFDDLLINGEGSATYKRLRDNNELNWGVRPVDTEEPPVSIGAMGLTDLEIGKPLPDWTSAESWLVFFDSAPLGKGLATRAYSHMVCSGLAMGLYVITAPVNINNRVSLRLHEKCGFLNFGPREGKEKIIYHDMRLYHPDVASTAIEHDFSSGRRVQTYTRFERALPEARVRVAQAMASLGYVQDIVASDPEAVNRFMQSKPRPKLGL